MGTRRKGREAALQILYQMDLSGVTASQALRLFFGHLAGEADGSAEPETDAEPDADEGGAEGEAFATELVEGYARESERIDSLIRGVSHHWRLERMARVDRNILRLSTYELLHISDIPRRVTLNEAVELAKRFGSEGSSGFVNGVLDRIATDAGKG